MRISFIKPIITLYSKWKMKYFYYALLCFLINSGCSQSKFENSDKFDAPLKQRLQQINNETLNRRINFIGNCETEINNKMVADIESMGIIISSKIGSIFTASGTKNSILKIAELKFIKYLELSLTREMKNNMREN